MDSLVWKYSSDIDGSGETSRLTSTKTGKRTTLREGRRQSHILTPALPSGSFALQRRTGPLSWWGRRHFPLGLSLLAGGAFATTPTRGGGRDSPEGQIAGPDGPGLGTAQPELSREEPPSRSGGPTDQAGVKMAASVELDSQPLNLELLPTDPLLFILSFLDYRDLMSAEKSQRNKNWKAIFIDMYADLGRYIHYYPTLKKAWDDLENYLLQRCPRMISSLKGIVYLFASLNHYFYIS
ncbi:F-box only protein 3 [Varanus komodoensis]|nr:F-box only protein 3 [Varanus komodoensis]